MKPEPYERESVLQSLIAQHPAILAGEEPDRPVLIHVKKEAPVQTEDEELFLDHLYLDQDGVPTLVEVKQAANREGRRAVVAQLLDYAAHAQTSFSHEKMRAWLEATAAAAGTSSEDRLAELGIDDPDDYWDKVRTNVDARRFRLVIVSDDIRPALRRIIEFLNDHTGVIEVLGIQVRQYRDSTGTQQILVPEFVGETQVAQDRKRARRGRGPLNRDRLLATYDDGSPEHAAVFGLLDWATARPDLKMIWSGAADVEVPAIGLPYLVRIWRHGSKRGGDLEVPLHPLRELERNPWDDERCLRLIKNLQETAGLHFNDDHSWPKAPIGPLADPHNRQGFIDVMDEVVQSLIPSA